jgi:hypothetical protein
MMFTESTCNLFKIDCADWKFTITADEYCRKLFYPGLFIPNLNNNENLNVECGFQEIYKWSKISSRTIIFLSCVEKSFKIFMIYFDKQPHASIDEKSC